MEYRGSKYGGTNLQIVKYSGLKFYNIMFPKFVAMITAASLLTMLNNRLLDSPVLKYGIYVLMTLLVFCVVRFTYKNKPIFYKNDKVIILLLLLSINLLLSPYDPLYPRLIKYLGYIGSFVFGYILCENNIPLKCNKWILFTLIFVPIVCVGLLDNTPHKTLFFELSNGFSYYGLCASLFIYTIYNEKNQIFKWTFFIILLYIASASTLGVVVAIALAILIINRKNLKLIFATFIMCIIAVMCIMHIDLPIFLRIRDVINLAVSLSWYDWTHLKDMDFYQMEMQLDKVSDRSDNTSFLWRLAHWQKMLDGYIENWWYAILFGLGDGYSVVKCGNYCHNEFLKFFAENGIIVFGILISWLKKANRILHAHKVYYFILAIICYHFTENLIDSFVPCVMFYFSLGFWYKKINTIQYIQKTR